MFNGRNPRIVYAPPFVVMDGRVVPATGLQFVPPPQLYTVMYKTCVESELPLTVPEMLYEVITDVSVKFCPVVTELTLSPVMEVGAKL